MAGRRLRSSIESILIKNEIVNATVTIAGLSNSYVHYVTTFEEYQAQRYEGKYLCAMFHPILELVTYVCSFESCFDSIRATYSSSVHSKF